MDSLDDSDHMRTRNYMTRFQLNNILAQTRLDSLPSHYSFTCETHGWKLRGLYFQSGSHAKTCKGHGPADQPTDRRLPGLANSMVLPATTRPTIYSALGEYLQN
ncbi:hypothetical protein Ddc_19535 [Ditylenchus destructor]|nr:hypothetical protein Ddc_19535 [Ditylenchus destructor]